MRAFVALRLSADALSALDDACERLRACWMPEGVRWVSPENRHLTLRFLGEGEARAALGLQETLGQIAAQTEPLALRLAPLGCFLSVRRPSVLWCGLDGDLYALKNLQRRVERVVQQAGWTAETRVFRPHITLGRVRPSVRASGVFPKVDVAPMSFLVLEMELIESRLERRGAVYRTIAKLRFSGPT